MLVQILDLVDYVQEPPGLNPFDKLLRFVYWFVPCRLDHDGRKVARDVLEKLILSLSDQQLVTGVAILSAGWIRHTQEKLYHFAMIMDLAWMSSSTHLLTLAVLPDYFSKYHEIRYWRLTLMLCNFAMQFVGSIYSAVSPWFDDFAYPAQCEFDAVNRDPSRLRGPQSGWAYFGAVALLFGYAKGMVGLFPGIWRPTAYSRRPGLRHLDHYFDSGHRYHSMLLQLHQTWSVRLRRLLLGLILGLCGCGCYLFITLFLIIRSTAWSVFVFSTLLFALGTRAIWDNRAYAKKYMEGNEDTWGFGQLVPLFLLALPLLSIVDNYYGRCNSLLEISAADGRLNRGTTKHSENSLNVLVSVAWSRLNPSQFAFNVSGPSLRCNKASMVLLHPGVHSAALKGRGSSPHELSHLGWAFFITVEILTTLSGLEGPQRRGKDRGGIVDAQYLLV